MVGSRSRYRACTSAYATVAAVYGSTADRSTADAPVQIGFLISRSGIFVVILGQTPFEHGRRKRNELQRKQNRKRLPTISNTSIAARFRRIALERHFCYRCPCLRVHVVGWH